MRLNASIVVEIYGLRKGVRYAQSVGASNNMKDPIFTQKFFGTEIKVFEKVITWTTWGINQVTLKVDQIASVKDGGFGSNIFIETTGGQKYKINSNNKKELMNAITTQMLNNY